MLRGAAALLALALGGCDASPVKVVGPPEASHQVCLSVLQFASDAERTAFMRANLDAIVRHAGAARLILATHPQEPVVAIMAADETCPADGFEAAYALRGAEGRAVLTEAMSIEAAATHISALFGEAPNLTERDPHRCVARIDGMHPSPATEQTMNALGFSGLRGAIVNIGPTTSGPAAFLGAEDSCSLVRNFTSAVLNAARPTNAGVAYCADASYVGCGWGGEPLQ